MSCNLDNVVNIHSRKVHESSAGSSCRMRMDQLVFLSRNFLLLSAISLDNVHNLGQSCSFADILDVSIDDLVLKMRHLEIILLQNPLQIR